MPTKGSASNQGARPPEPQRAGQVGGVPRAMPRSPHAHHTRSNLFSLVSQSRQSVQADSPGRQSRQTVQAVSPGSQSRQFSQSSQSRQSAKPLTESQCVHLSITYSRSYLSGPTH
eukprot:9245654-Pyramimonas_sp.AAC.1